MSGSCTEVFAHVKVFHAIHYINIRMQPYLVPDVRPNALLAKHFNVLKDDQSDILIVLKAFLGQIHCDLEELEPNASMRRARRQVVGPALLLQQ